MFYAGFQISEGTLGPLDCYGNALFRFSICTMEFSCPGSAFFHGKRMLKQQQGSSSKAAAADSNKQAAGRRQATITTTTSSSSSSIQELKHMFYVGFQKGCLAS